MCQSRRDFQFRQMVLRKYEADYVFCSRCGLLQAHKPSWLKEAYSSAIANADTGLLSRNINVARRLSGVLFYLMDPNGRYLDFAGGYGVLTRLMRDIGFEFYWSDPYCENLLARGFEHTPDISEYRAVTAFEVMEHIENPFDFVSGALRMARAGTMIFSTVLFEDCPPAPEKWWYYAFETGQHISFYQKRTLTVLADRLCLNFCSHGDFHMLTDRKVNNHWFRILTGHWVSLLCYQHVIRKMSSRIWEDHLKMMRRY